MINTHYWLIWGECAEHKTSTLKGHDVQERYATDPSSSPSQQAPSLEMELPKKMVADSVESRLPRPWVPLNWVALFSFSFLSFIFFWRRTSLRRRHCSVRSGSAPRSRGSLREAKGVLPTEACAAEGHTVLGREAKGCDGFPSGRFRSLVSAGRFGAVRSRGEAKPDWS